MCEITSEDYSEVWEEQEVTARKPHRCSCCNGAIAKGDRYVRHFSVFEREPTHEKMCAPCAAICADFEKEHGHRFTPGVMREAISDCVAEGETGGERWELALDQMSARRAARLAAEAAT